MNGNKHNHNIGPQMREEQVESISVEQLRHLVRLLDRSDVSEIELKRVKEGTHLVLRKAKAAEGSAQRSEQGTIIASSSPTQPAETKHRVIAQLVGIFHCWAKPQGNPLVAIGDRVKAGQLLATIQSLNVLSEIEAPLAGRIVEILVQDGQPIEYGQPLMIIDSAEGA
jgi:biotin carboxyl carrier protein